MYVDADVSTDILSRPSMLTQVPRSTRCWAAAEMVPCPPLHDVVLPARFRECLSGREMTGLPMSGHVVWLPSVVAVGGRERSPGIQLARGPANLPGLLGWWSQAGGRLHWGGSTLASHARRSN